jgi:hypothetical protein
MTTRRDTRSENPVSAGTFDTAAGSPEARLRAVGRRVTGWLAVALVAFASMPRVAAGQTITGAVVDATTSAPLPGVLVSLLDLDGERIRATLSDETGRFFFEPGGFGRYSLRAERIGLQTTTSASFDVVSTNPHFERILMGDRAIEITGLIVDSRVKQCRLDRDEAVQIQRWWREVRTALDVSSVVQSSGMAQFEIDRFQREWDAQLERVIADDTRAEVSISTRPFASAEADFLSEGGFVQGELTGQREYYAPDADVLLSSTFLSEHCFSIASSEGDPKLVGLAFEPTGDRNVADIDGVIWVDSTTAELRAMDFHYTELGDVPDNEAGGSVWFEYLPSGAWIVRYWYIRMPKFGQRVRRGGTELVLLGYVDVGGQVRPLATSSVSMQRAEGLGAVRGVVWDSIRARGLPDATVSVFGTRLRTRTDEDGRFYLPQVPAGDQRLTFVHDDTRAWGLGGALVPVEVQPDGEASARLAIPTFRQVARIVCLGSGGGAETVLVGKLVDAEESPLGNVPIGFTWSEEARGAVEVRREMAARTGSDGRFVVCTIPSAVQVSVKAEVGGRWLDLFEIPLPPGEIAFRQVLIPVR